jgi:hypothetical protein
MRELPCKSKFGKLNLFDDNFYFSFKLSEAPFWYAWGPSQEFRFEFFIQYILFFCLSLCDKCWMVWKKRGGLKNPHELG